MNQPFFSLASVIAVFLAIAACKTSKKIRQQPNVQIPSHMEEINTNPENSKTDTLMENILKKYPTYFEAIQKNKLDWKVQIIYTQIDRKADNSPSFKTHYYNYDPNSYFYPASTVKMPVAFLALQRLNELKISGVDKNTTMITGVNYSGQTPVYNEPMTHDARPTIASYIKKIFLVSDNDAYNRLYEFLGQEYINSQLHKMGYKEAEIVHRLSIILTPDENRHTNPITFFNQRGDILFNQPALVNQKKYSQRNDFMGKAYYKGTQLINEPLDFSLKNRISLGSLTDLLKSVLFPYAVPKRQRFNLTTEDYKFLRQSLSQLPAESVNPSFDTLQIWPAYVKFLLYGSEKGALPGNIRIFNKVGDAYGGLSDVAYIVDFDKKIEFMISARIYCNSDGILNDDKYDYDTIGLPFMKHLGEVIYEYELNRRRRYSPDLSELKMSYDK
jgi:Beta-lactamase enzyme family